MNIQYSLFEYIFFIYALISTTATGFVHASPTNVGKVHTNTPPFFTKEFYAQTTQNKKSVAHTENIQDPKKETKVR